MPWCSSLLIHLGEPTYFRDMLPFSSLCKNNFKNLILPPLKFSAVFFIHRVIQIGYLLYITIFSWEENCSRCAAPASAVFSVKLTTVTNPFLLKLPQCHIFTIFFRVFRWEWAGQHLHEDPAAPVHEDHARNHVQAGGALCSLCAAHGQAEESGESHWMLPAGVSLNLSAHECGHGHTKNQGKAQGTKLGNPIWAALPRKQQCFTGSSWGRAGHTLCSAEPLLCCRRDAGESSCGRKCVHVPGCCRSCSQAFSLSWCPGDQLGWSPLRPYPSWAAFTFGIRLGDFCSILPWLGKVCFEQWACC